MNKPIMDLPELPKVVHRHYNGCVHGIVMQIGPKCFRTYHWVRDTAYLGSRWVGGHAFEDVETAIDFTGREE